MNTYPGAVALTDGRHQQRGVGGAKAKALPARHQTGAIGACNDLIVEPRQRGHVQARAGLGKGAIRHFAHQRTIGTKAAEERIEHGLLG